MGVFFIRQRQSRIFSFLSVVVLNKNSILDSISNNYIVNVILCIFSAIVHKHFNTTVKNNDIKSYNNNTFTCVHTTQYTQYVIIYYMLYRVTRRLFETILYVVIKGRTPCIKQSSAETRVSRSPTQRCCYLRNEKSRRITDATVIPVVFPRLNIIINRLRWAYNRLGVRYDGSSCNEISQCIINVYKNKRNWNWHSFLALHIIIKLLNWYYILLCTLYWIISIIHSFKSSAGCNVSINEKNIIILRIIIHTFKSFLITRVLYQIWFC